MNPKTCMWASLLLTSLSPLARADHIAGTGELSGTVTAPSAYTAAKVFAHLSGKNITYVVFTAGGRYSAVNVMPGTYEVWVEKPGFASEKKTVVVAPSKQAIADLTLRTAPLEPTYIGARLVKRDVEPFDTIYPPGPGRDIIDRTCFVCHGLNFLSAMHQDRQGWTAAIDYMMGVPHWGIRGTPPFLSADRLPAADREVVLDYLATNFGPDMPERIVGGEPDGPKDEAVLGKAMIIEYELPNDAVLKHRITQEISFDSKGNVWVTDVRDRGALTRIDPRTGAYQDYPTPGEDWNPHGIAVDADDTVWFAALKAGLGHLDPVSGKFDLYGKTAAKRSGGLSPFFDSQGNVYWTDIYMNELGRWDRRSDTWKRYPDPTPAGAPYGLVVDRKDNAWFAEFHGCAVVRFDPRTEEMKRYKSPSAPCTIRRPGVDSQGNIWYGVWSRGRIERLEPDTGKVTAFDVPVRFANPYDTWVDANDIVWSSSDNFIIRLDPRTSKFSYYPTPRQTDEPKITITRDGAIWYPPRGYSSNPGVTASADVLYPDKAKMKTFAAYFSDTDANANARRYHGPRAKVAGNAVAQSTSKSDDARNRDLGQAAD